MFAEALANILAVYIHVCDRLEFLLFVLSRPASRRPVHCFTFEIQGCSIGYDRASLWPVGFDSYHAMATWGTLLHASCLR